MSENKNKAAAPEQSQAPAADATLQAKVEALEAIVTEQDLRIKSLEEENEQLRTGAAGTRSLGDAPGGLPTFTIGKRTYQFTAGKFKLDGEVLEAAKVVNDPAWLKKAVAEGYGFIKEVK